MSFARARCLPSPASFRVYPLTSACDCRLGLTLSILARIMTVILSFFRYIYTRGLIRSHLRSTFYLSLSFISEFNLHHHLLASTPPSSTVPSIHLGLSTKTQVTSFQTSGFIFRKSQMTQKSMLQSLDINGHLPRAREHLNTEQSLSELALKPERRELVI